MFNASLNIAWSKNGVSPAFFRIFRVTVLWHMQDP